MNSANSPGTSVMARLETILRRDLKLGPDVPITPDTAMIGGEYDLDSLDVLLLLTSIEKEFQIKIPSEEVQRDAFKNLQSLAGFVERRIQHANHE